MRLNKTAAELLRRAAAHASGRVYVHHWRRGDACGGTRELAAMQKLVAAGLLDSYRAEHHSGLGFNQSAWNHPRTTHSIEAAASITDAGRVALATIKVK